MAILCTALWIVLGILAALVLVPFHARGFASVHDASPDASARLDWGWGLVAVSVSRDGAILRLLGLRVWRLSRRAAPSEKEPSERESWLKKLRALIHYRKELIQMAARLARALHLRVRASGVVGIGDPADTAFLVSVARLIEELPGVELALSWDWVDEELELEAEGSARIWIAHLLCVAAALLWHRENRVALRAVS